MFNDCPKDNGWFGCFATIHDSNTDVKLMGITSVNLVKGMQLDVEATTHPKELDTYNIIQFKIITKTTKGLISYLSSIQGISVHTAHNIVFEYGEDTLNMLKNNPDEIKQKLGLKDKQIQAILKGINSANELNKLRQFLPELSEKLVRRVHDYFDDAEKTIKSDPYVLNEVTGISFPTIDTIAIRLGINPLSPIRVNHGLVNMLKNDSSGNLFINLSNDAELNHLCVSLESALKIRFNDITDFANRLQQLAAIKDSPIVIEAYNNQAHLYLKEIYDAMVIVIDTIKRALNDVSYSIATGVNINQCILEYENKQTQKHSQPFNFTQEQKISIINAVRNKISIITGEPGCGKTSVIDAIAKCWTKQNESEILLFAPTGRAANKLKTETNGIYQTETIDKFIVRIEHDKHAKKLLKKINTPKTLVVIDESSMIDLVKASSLITYLDNCQFCFVGDINQLPPISPGAFLKDLIASNKIPTTRLTKCLRNSGLILDNADKINHNNINLQYDFTQMPFYPQLEDNQTALDFVLDQYNDERINCPDITQIALLSPTKKGILGTISLNMAIQNIICPENPNAQSTMDWNHGYITYSSNGYPILSTIYGDGNNFTRFRIGDIVVNTKNQNSLETFTYTNNDYWNGTPENQNFGIFNGDCGRIIGYISGFDNKSVNDDDHDYIIVQFFDNRFATLDLTKGDFEHFQLGYAITVHKAQGCEYNTVIFVSPKSMLNMISFGFGNKNLVYTAITRAKKRCVIIGSKDSLNECIKTNIVDKHSTLAEKLQQ